jgi:hypothetical protein
VDQWGLRIKNETNETIAIVINPRLPNGGQGKQVVWHLPPGKDTDDMLPPKLYDTDGIYVYGELSDGYVYKIADGVFAIARNDGIYIDHINSTLVGLAMQYGRGEDNAGGWHDEHWAIEEKGWPRCP